MKKILKLLLMVIILIVIIVISIAIIFVKDKLNKINYENVTKEDIEITEGIEEQLEEYRNIVILGLDSLDNTFANSRSDCIIIVSINNITKEVKLVSVYRDTYLKISGYGLDKVTHAYAYGRAPLALSTLNTNLDLDITEYVTINFESVINIVDAIGGVQMEVTSAEASQIPGISGAGTYTLTGEQALAYGRIRKIDSDYARTERMRKVLTKLFEKAKTLSIGQLNSLADELLPKVVTNITQTEIIKMIPVIKDYSIVTSIGWPYNVQGKTFSAWYAVPVTLEENVKQLHAELFQNE